MKNMRRSEIGAKRRRGAGWRIALAPGGGEYRSRVICDADGVLALNIVSPRPLRIFVNGVCALDEPLYWRDYQRRIHASVLAPIRRGETEIRWEVGERPRHPENVDRNCPSRNRARLMRALARAIPDRIEARAAFQPGRIEGALSLRFTPQQFIRDRLVWQSVWTRSFSEFSDAPSANFRAGSGKTPAAFRLEAEGYPGRIHEATPESDTVPRARQYFLPVGGADDRPRIRAPGEDHRLEPACDIVARRRAVVETTGGRFAVEMPVFESLGRLAPRREYAPAAWPAPDAAPAGLPAPILPPEHLGFGRLYDAAWRMLLGLAHTPRLESGLPGSRIGTGANFTHYQFVWDTSFAAMATAYGWRVLPAYETLDALYSRQFDGGYIHREIDVRDGLPVLYEPDFSPNPPVMAIAEWAIYELNGDLERLRRVYPALAEHHAWLANHRRLPDGTYWTTGLANGLDNSPSLGEGYPCLTAQMAHHAETLARMADALGRKDDAARWICERDAIGEALNRRLWSPELRFYSTSLKGGGHNPNKVVTGFWPLWAGVVPPERVEDLARHLKDPNSFWRHHPIPSLAADSPHYRPGGDYWRGSTWAPTNFAAIQGFARAGRWALAREAAERHLRAMLETYEATGYIWENYCAERSAPGSWSGRNYCWSAAGPIALLFEILIGLRPDAPNRALRWRLPESPGRWGAARYPLGPCTVEAVADIGGETARLSVSTDYPLTLILETADGRRRRIACSAGKTQTEAPLAQNKG